MNQPTLPIPNATEWLTTKAAAFLLGVSPRTVERLAERGALKAYRPYAAPKEKAPAMFWRAAVNELVDARAKIAATTGKDPGGY